MLGNSRETQASASTRREPAPMRRAATRASGSGAMSGILGQIERERTVDADGFARMLATLAARFVRAGFRELARDAANAAVCGLGVYWWVSRAFGA